MYHGENETLAGYTPAPLENWYRHHYFNNTIDISGSGVEEYTFREIQQIAGFSFSEMDDKPVKDAMTAGGDDIKRLIDARFGVGDPDKIMITNGSNEALQLVIRSILDPGDEIVTQGPCYHCHDKIAISMGCQVRKWNFCSGNQVDTLDEFNALVTSRTKAVVLNFPHNPTGRTIDDALLERIMRVVMEHGIYLIWDAAFQELTYESPPLKDPVHFYDKAISVGTFSKAYGAPGLRFGWTVMPNNIVPACIRQKDYGNLYVAPITEFVASKMLEKLEDFSGPRLKQATENRKIVDDWVAQHEEFVDWQAPGGGVCGLLRLPQDREDHSFCTDLLEKFGVLLVPGSCFDSPGHVRLGFGGKTSDLITGLDRLSEFVEFTQ